MSMKEQVKALGLEIENLEARIKTSREQEKEINRLLAEEGLTPEQRLELEIVQLQTEQNYQRTKILLGQAIQLFEMVSQGAGGYSDV
jgi:alpha-ketoglutarate-dependent taurine dioxygenase